MNLNTRITVGCLLALVILAVGCADSLDLYAFGTAMVVGFAVIAAPLIDIAESLKTKR